MLGGISKIIKTIVGKSESVQKRKTIQLIGNKKVVKADAFWKGSAKAQGMVYAEEKCRVSGYSEFLCFSDWHGQI